MFGHVAEIIVVDLFFIQDAFEQAGAHAVAVGATDFQQLVVGLDGVVFHLHVEGKYVHNLLPFRDLGRQLAVRLPAQFLDALGKLFGMAHFVDGDQFDLAGEFAIVQVIQIVVLVHVLMHGIQFHAPSLVQHFNNLGHAFFFGGFLCHSLYPH